jgi:hypothetical protein
VGEKVMSTTEPGRRDAASSSSSVGSENSASSSGSEKSSIEPVIRSLLEVLLSNMPAKRMLKRGDCIVMSSGEERLIHLWNTVKGSSPMLDLSLAWDEMKALDESLRAARLGNAEHSRSGGVRE